MNEWLLIAVLLGIAINVLVLSLRVNGLKDRIERLERTFLVEDDLDTELWDWKPVELEYTEPEEPK